MKATGSKPPPAKGGQLFLENYALQTTVHFFTDSQVFSSFTTFIIPHNYSQYLDKCSSATDLKEGISEGRIFKVFSKLILLLVS